VDLLRGRSTDQNRPLFWHYPHYSPQGGEPAGAVRAGDWKLIQFFGDGRIELYNLKEDPGEQRNLALRLPKKAEQLLKLMRTWREDVGASVPPANPNLGG
jgi:arylsulfatase A